MKTTILSKNYGNQTIDLENFDPCTTPTSSTVFKVIEHIFDSWFEYSTQAGAPMAKDIEGMYNGEGDQPAIYSKRGAIIQGMETLRELLMDEFKAVITTRDILKMDIESAFE